MRNIWLILCSLFSIVTAAEPPQRVWMDDYGTCSYQNTIFVEDGKSYLIHARQTRDVSPPNIKSCEVIVGPYGEDRSLNVQFRNFYILTCGVTFTISEGRSSTMLEEKQLRKFDCNTKGKAREQSFKLSESNVYLRLHLERTDPSDLRFNFLLNITSVPIKPEEEGLSIGVKIGIAVLSVIAFIMIVFFIYKTVRVKMSMNEECENATNLYNLSGSHHSSLNAYVPMPHKDTVRQIRTPDPDIYFDFNPAQSHELLENGASPTSSTSSKTEPLLPPPPPYEEAIQECLPLSEVEQQYDIEYENFQPENTRQTQS